MADTVSVIIPAYNAAAHIVRAIDSALKQTLPPIEILVIDDGSKDRTAEVVAALPPPVRLIRKENGGPASARNLGASQARGDWLALLDADDWWFPDKLRIQLGFATAPEVGLIHCLPDHRNDLVPVRPTFDDMWARNWIINSSVLIRRAAFEALGGFNEAKALISVEDYNLWIRTAASDWQIVTCPQVLVHYTRGIGISSNSERFMRASLFNIEDLGRRLQLPETLVRQKRAEIIFDFGRKALYERELPVARRLFWQAFRREPSMRNALHLMIAAMPEPVLDIRRKTLRMLEHDGGGSSPAGAGGNGNVTTIDEAWLLDPARLQASILDRRFHAPVTEAALSRPVLVTTVDAEEDFDWTRPFSRASTDVTSMRSQHVVHPIFERYGVVPTYMVDHPVASQDQGREPLKELLQDGKCEIGAQLHPWVTPPFIEYVSSRNSYPGNLPAAIEFAKIQALTDELQAAFGVAPRIFRAGRYGAGPNTGNILHHFGYEVDSSVVPCWNFSSQGGPDFRQMTATPYWIDRDRRLLELPVSAAVVGRAAALPANVTSRLFGRGSERVGLPSVMSRLGLLERIKLTPEGIAIEEAKRLVRHMAAAGHRIFVLTYHSPSLEPGNTPYVRSQADLARFLNWLDEFYDFFIKEIGGTCASWRDVRASLLAAEPNARLLNG
jgi:glycosyltransferase involved in cell wall biosynthesis